MSEKTKSTSKSKKNSPKKKTATPKEVTYQKVTITCACGAEFESGSTMDSIRIDICSKCHPFFTGDQRYIDTEGRVEKFMKKYKLSEK